MLSQRAAGQFWARERFADYSAGDLIECCRRHAIFFFESRGTGPSYPFSILAANRTDYLQSGPRSWSEQEMLAMLP